MLLKSLFGKGGFRGNAVHLNGGGQNVGRALPAKILKTNSRGRLFYIILPWWEIAKLGIGALSEQHWI